MDRRKNGITFRKCQFQGEKAPCEHCQANHVKAEQFLSILRSAGGFIFEPTPAPNLEGHYMTFLEMLNSSGRYNFSKPNEVLPSKPVGKCLMCNASQFPSTTESKRYVSNLHLYYREDAIPTTEEQNQFVCKVTTCNRVFFSISSINQA